MGHSGAPVNPYRIGEAAALLGVSADTMRRWVDAGRVVAERDEHGHRIIPGAELAAFARELARPENAAEGGPPPRATGSRGSSPTWCSVTSPPRWRSRPGRSGWSR